MNVLLWIGLVAFSVGVTVAVCAGGRTTAALRHSGTGLAVAALTLLLTGLWTSGSVSAVEKTAVTLVVVVLGTVGLYRIDTRTRPCADTRTSIATRTPTMNDDLGCTAKNEARLWLLVELPRDCVVTCTGIQPY